MAYIKFTDSKDGKMLDLILMEENKDGDLKPVSETNPLDETVGSYIAYTVFKMISENIDGLYDTILNYVHKTLGEEKDTNAD